MNLLPESQAGRERVFNIIKYLVYGWLTYNGYLFWETESLAQEVTFARELTLEEVIKVYSASIDTFFWILLVVLLELETWVLEDDVLNRPLVKWGLIALRTICYIMIMYAFYGYVVKAAFQTDILPFAIANACDLINQNYSILLELEEYIPLTESNCQTLNGQELSRLNGYNIIATHDVAIYSRNVAWIDIFNASTWLGIVAILELDIWFQLKGMYKGRLLRISTILKTIFYSILFICAIAWGYTGVFLDFMDAFLWLFAFVFIEMNLFQWQQETEEKTLSAAKAE